MWSAVLSHSDCMSVPIYRTGQRPHPPKVPQTLRLQAMVALSAVPSIDPRGRRASAGRDPHLAEVPPRCQPRQKAHRKTDLAWPHTLRT